MNPSINNNFQVMTTKFLRKANFSFIMLGLASSAIAAYENSEVDQADLQITVTATRTERQVYGTPGSISVITSDGINSLGSSNAADIVKYEPLVSIPFDFIGSDGFIPYNHGGYTSYNIRGIEGNRVLVSINGIRLPEEFVISGGTGRDYFDPEIFGRVEVFKGAASNLYGSDALGGVVELSTLKPDSYLSFSDRPSYFGVKTRYTSANNSFSVIPTAAFEQGKLKGLIRYAYREGEEMENNSDIPPNPENFTGQHVLGVLEIKLNENNTLNLTSEHFERSVDYQPDSAAVTRFDGAFLITNVDHSDDLSRSRFSIEHQLRNSNTAIFDSLKSHFYYQDSKQDTSNLQQGVVFGSVRNRFNDINFHTEILGIDIQTSKAFSWGKSEHLLSYGINISISDISNDFFRENLPPAEASTEDRIGMAPSEVSRFGFYLQDEIYIGSEDRFTIIPGLRVDHYRIGPENSDNFVTRTQGIRALNYDDWSVAPKIGLLYELTDNWNIWGQASIGFRNPTASEFSGTFTHGTDFIVVPNSDLNEEKVFSIEVGSKASTAGLDWQLSFFYNDYSNFLESNVDTGEDSEILGFLADVLTTINRGDVVIYGFEFAGSAHLGKINSGLEGFGLGFNAGLAGGRDRTGNDWLITVDPFQATAHLSYEHREGKWGVRLSSTIIDEKHRVPSTATFVPEAATVVDLNAFVNISENLSLNAGLNNLLDEQYNLWTNVRQGGHGGAGRPKRLTQPGVNGWVSLNLRY